MRIDGAGLRPAARALALEEILEHVAEGYIGGKIGHLQLDAARDLLRRGDRDDSWRELLGKVGDSWKLLNLLGLCRNRRRKAVKGSQCQGGRYCHGQDPFHRSIHNRFSVIKSLVE